MFVIFDVSDKTYYQSAADYLWVDNPNDAEKFDDRIVARQTIADCDQEGWLRGRLKIQTVGRNYCRG